METPAAKSGPPVGPQRILIGFDGSDPSQRAARLALAWGKATGASLWVVHASETPQAVAEPRTDEEQSMAEAAVTEALADLTRYAEALEVTTTVWMRDGAPARVLLDSAAEMRADLIIVGTRGLRGPARVLLGSVSSAVLSQAGRPVLVVP
jgi:nucleotide-binding universal stress UspA family protein